MPKAVRERHPSKACSLMLKIPVPNAIELKALQALKAYLPMLVTPFGMLMLVRFKQESKAKSPISVTVLGRVTLVLVAGHLITLVNVLLKMT